jgi:hypothetical protein
MAVQSVSGLDNLSQFIQLVSAARARNNGTTSVTPHSGAQKAAFTSQASAAGGMQASVETKALGKAADAATMQKTASTRHLGTRFDAYA